MGQHYLASQPVQHIQYCMLLRGCGVRRSGGGGHRWGWWKQGVVETGGVGTNVKISTCVPANARYLVGRGLT